MGSSSSAMSDQIGNSIKRRRQTVGIEASIAPKPPNRQRQVLDRTPERSMGAGVWTTCSHRRAGVNRCVVDNGTKSPTSTLPRLTWAPND